ncbi:LpxI family protein [Acidocella sp.]|uniref:LpxI family protein n=1 Tax=Acidocella sp. TaxID=50710 RepID=UPI0026092774|nr:UDP-2,3-diacylglucosamine diphosphatase LpxI [Acidocella sp.]
MSRKLGIIAGGGPLPGQVAQAAVAAGRDVFIVGLEGFAAPDVLRPFAHKFFRLGALGAIHQALRDEACRDLVMIGPVKRPSILSLRPDLEGTRLLARVGKAAFSGDDGLLSAIVRIMNEEGFAVLGAHEILTDMLAPAGVLTTYPPDEAARADIERGIAALKLIGAADIGQACVVQQGIVLAVEAVEGTDAMLSRIPAVHRPGPAGVLVKIAKPGQEKRADMPTIGAATITHAASAGLRGIAYEAGATILANRIQMIDAANAAGLFLVGVDVVSNSENGERSP